MTTLETLQYYTAKFRRAVGISAQPTNSSGSVARPRGSSVQSANQALGRGSLRSSRQAKSSNHGFLYRMMWGNGRRKREIIFLGITLLVPVVIIIAGHAQH